MRGPNTLKWRQLVASNPKANKTSKRNMTLTNKDEKNRKNIKKSRKNVFDPEEIKTAIVELQTFFNLPESGKLDEDTKNKMKQLRCGNTDISATNKQIKKTRRIKRKTDPMKVFRWFYSKPEQTYTWTFLADTTSSERGTFFRDYIEYGMNMWAEVANVNFKYVPNDYADIIDILVMFKKGKGSL